MREVTRRQMLSDMGIVRWRLRDVRAAPRPERAPEQPTAEVPPRRRRLRDTPAAPRVERPVAPVAAEVAAAAGAPAASPAATACSAVSLAAPGVVLLVDGASSKRDLRLALDVVAAATRDWRRKPVSRRFDWPAADSAPRALNAFVQKDLEDHGARLLVCVETLAAVLPEAGDHCRRLVIPALPALGRDAAAKRAVWQSLADVGA